MKWLLTATWVVTLLHSEALGHKDVAGSCDSPRSGHHERGLNGTGGYVLRAKPRQHRRYTGVMLRLEHKRGRTFRGFQIICEQCNFLRPLSEDVQFNTRHCELPGRVSHTGNSDKEFVEVEARLVPPGSDMINVSYYVVKTLLEWYGPMQLTLDLAGNVINREKPPPHIASSTDSSLSDDDDDEEHDDQDHNSQDRDGDEGHGHEHSSRNDGTEDQEDDEESGHRPRHHGEDDEDEEEENHRHHVQNQDEGDDEEEVEVTSNASCEKSTEKGFNCMAKLKDYFIVHWSVNATKPNSTATIKMLMMANTPGWGSLAFARIKGKMHPADAVLGWMADDGDHHVESYHIINDDVTPQNANKSLFAIHSISRRDSWLHIHFTKSVDSGYIPVNLQESSFINYATGKENRLEKHDRYGTVVLDFFTGSVRDVSPRKFYQAHGCLMIIAWIVLIPLSMNIARSKWSPAGMGLQGWFDIHRGLTLFAVIAIIPALLIAVIDFQSTESRTGRVHSLLGVMSSIFLFAQICMGMLRPSLGSVRRPVFNVAHAWAGRCIWLLSCITVFVGISAFSLKVGSDPTPWVVVVLLLIIAHLLTAIYFEHFVRNRAPDRAGMGEVGMVPIPYSRPGDADSEEHYNSE